MGMIIDWTTSAETVDVVITDDKIGRALIARGDLAANIIAVEYLDKNGDPYPAMQDGEAITLNADNQAVGLYSAIGRIRIKKPVTTNEVAVFLGA